MTTMHTAVDVRIRDGQVVDRRTLLHGVSAAAAAAGLLSWPQWMSLQAEELRRQGKAMILLWMQGGPSQFETFDPKPKSKTGGETKAISTSVPGIQIAENLPHLARSMEDLCLLRSLTTKEGSHPRATFLMHTGYLPTAAVKHPAFGANVAQQLGDPASDLPGFVRVGTLRGGPSAGFLGVEYNPLEVAAAGEPPANAKLNTSEARYRRRLQLQKRLGVDFAQAARDEAAEHQQLYDSASRLVLSPQMEAFDLSREPARVRAAYGRGPFADGCLLARRLIEEGVPFVEVVSSNWDTHFDNFNRTKQLCGQIDQPTAQLIADLKQRGRLDDTLVVWMGEFGRTPRINGRQGRDHYPRAFNAMLAGGGVRGGQVVGETDAEGYAVRKRPIGTTDLLRTFCTSLGMDADQENLSAIGRPIKVVDEGESVREVFG